MKYAIPTKGNKGLDDEIDHHFGKAPFFTIWNEQTSEIEIVENVGDHAHGVCLPADFLAERCNGLICGGIGRRAIQRCSQLGLAVYIGAEGSVKNIISAYKEGQLKLASTGDGCEH